MADQYAHGSLSKLTVNTAGTGSATVICITKFEWEQVYDKSVTTSTCSAGFEESQLGVKRLNFNGEGKLDLSNTPWSKIQNGSKVAVSWFANSTGSANVTIPTATIDNIKITETVEDVISYTFSGTSSGTYTLA